ncbi:MAG: hypothetical protein ACRAVC_15450 [Trichormus sp.]
MKSTDVVELRIRRNQNSDAGKLIKFLMDYEANQGVNPAGDNATKLALKTLRLFFMPYVLEALGDRSFFEGMRDLVYPTIAKSYLADGTTF